MSVGDEYSNTSTTSLQNHLLHNDNTIEETIIHNTNNQASEAERNNNTTEAEVRGSTPRQDKETEINNQTKESEDQGSSPKEKEETGKAKNEFAEENPNQNEVRGSSPKEIEEKDKKEQAKEIQYEVSGSSPTEIAIAKGQAKVEVQGSNPNPEKQNVATKEAKGENERMDTRAAPFNNIELNKNLIQTPETI